MANGQGNDFVDMAPVARGELAGLTEAELRCYHAGESAGVELAVRCARLGKRRARRMWARIWTDSAGGGEQG